MTGGGGRQQIVQRWGALLQFGQAGLVTGKFSMARDLLGVYATRVNREPEKDHIFRENFGWRNARDKERRDRADWESVNNKNGWWQGWNGTIPVRAPTIVRDSPEKLEKFGPTE